MTTGQNSGFDSASAEIVKEKYNLSQVEVENTLDKEEIILLGSFDRLYKILNPLDANSLLLEIIDKYKDGYIIYETPDLNTLNDNQKRKVDTILRRIHSFKKEISSFKEKIHDFTVFDSNSLPYKNSKSRNPKITPTDPLERVRKNICYDLSYLVRNRCLSNEFARYTVDIIKKSHWYRLDLTYYDILKNIAEFVDTSPLYLALIDNYEDQVFTENSCVDLVVFLKKENVLKHQFLLMTLEKTLAKKWGRPVSVSAFYNYAEDNDLLQKVWEKLLIFPPGNIITLDMYNAIGEGYKGLLWRSTLK